MNFEDFRKDIESRLISKIEFELLEFNFLPYSFGSGLLPPAAARILSRGSK